VHQVLDTPADVVHLRADLPNLHADGCGGRGGWPGLFCASALIGRQGLAMLADCSMEVRCARCFISGLWPSCARPAGIVQLHQSLVSYLGPVLRLYACQHVPLSTLYVDFEQAHLPA
jgi:hypothetical protein